MMSETRTAATIFDQEFLPIRAKLLEIGAALDRFGRAEGDTAKDPRWHAIQAAISTLLRSDDDRAEKIQLIFSRPYSSDWRGEFGMSNDE
jgi:hypothetical protein